MGFRFIDRFWIAVGVVLALGVLPGSKGKQCVGLGPCMCVFDDGSGTADMTTTGNTDGTAKYADYTALYDSFLYSYNPCYSFTENSCTDAAMCQSDYSQQSWKTGEQSTATWSFDGTNIQVYYSANTDVMRESFITVICDKGYDEPFVEIQGEETEGSAQYYGRITSKCACPDGCHKTTYNSNVEVTLTGGSILLIILFVLISVYLVGGVTYNKYRRQATGIEVLPNSSFWGALPGLVKEGVCFVLGCVRRGGGQKSSYQNI
ncbi:cation-dependent mannose-6-phosphate receptor-like [Haliotis rufescens]|uniref:cation-dependent mannose-6-phosphate receptor-like n=1 Tax=Haliotis rufescens TaxID=6454 RepID=UPI00201EC47C|nr:cation-dependent mannose-6-phosphate receptor-like [Haliotis rufescens]